MTAQFFAPEPLKATHIVEHFNCGESTLDDWLKRRALTNHLSGASRTFVALDGQNHVRAYYAIAAGAVAHDLATGLVRRNMPDPVPVLVLGRLAVNGSAQGSKLGAYMLQDAIRRAATVAENASVRALLVHALNESAQAFYEHFGFSSSPTHPMTLMLRLSLLKA